MTELLNCLILSEKNVRRATALEICAFSAQIQEFRVCSRFWNFHR